MNETPTRSHSLWQPWPSLRCILLFPVGGDRDERMPGKTLAAVCLHVSHQHILPPSLQANCTHTASTTESFIGAAEDSSGFICLCSSRRYRPKCFHLLLLGVTQTAVAVTFYFFCLVQKFLGGDTIFSFLPVDDDSSNGLNKNTVSAIIKLQPFLHTALSRQALRCNWIHKHDLKQLFYWPGLFLKVLFLHL